MEESPRTKEFKKAYFEGEIIQVRGTITGEWYDLDIPMDVDDEAYEFRIKPKAVDFVTKGQRLIHVDKNGKHSTPYIVGLNGVGPALGIMNIDTGDSAEHSFCTDFGPGQGYVPVKPFLIHLKGYFMLAEEYEKQQERKKARNK